jgi:DNA-binding winged helix-turn-helix (wHTH) protein
MPATLTRYAFGPYELLPNERLLLRSGQGVDLPSKAFDVLAVLVTHAGRLVTKEELLEAVWPGVVVAEGSLSAAVSRLRTALGEPGRGYVRAVPGHGYRFVAPVTAYEAAEPYPLSGDATAEGPRVEDVVPTLSGDGVGRIARAPLQEHPARGLPEAAVSAPAARLDRKTRPVGLLAGAGTFALLAFVLFTRGERPAEAPVPPANAATAPPAEALLAYRRGRALWESRGWETMDEALSQFQLARTLDATFAPAYVGEAQVYAIGYRTGPAAEAALARALALDSTLAEAWATLGFVRAFQEWVWAGAEAAFARATALDPENVTTLQWLASLRMVQRRLPEAEAALRRAITLRPDYAALHVDLCEVLYYRRAYVEAEAACARALALDPENPTARNHLEARIGLAGSEGRAAAARELARGRTSFDAYARARLHARLGQRDSALAYVERAVVERTLMAPFLHPDPLFDPYRDDARWVAAVRRMGLE